MSESRHTPSLEWCAGLFEGEGWLCLHRRKAKDRIKTRADLMVGMTNTECVLLEVLANRWGGRLRPRKGTALSRLPLFEWRLEGKKAEIVLLDLLPFLVGAKRSKAEAALTERRNIKPMERRENGTFKPKA